MLNFEPLPYNFFATCWMPSRCEFSERIDSPILRFRHATFLTCVTRLNFVDSFWASFLAEFRWKFFCINPYWALLTIDPNKTLMNFVKDFSAKIVIEICSHFFKHDSLINPFPSTCTWECLCNLTSQSHVIITYHKLKI